MADITETATTLKQCLTELPKEEPRNFVFDDIDIPPPLVMFFASLTVLVVNLVDIKIFFSTRRRLRYFLLVIFITFIALLVTWSQNVVEVAFQIRNMYRDSKWVSIASTCYKRFQVLHTWNFRPWMPLIVDFLRIIASTLESFVILLGIIQDYLVKRRVKRRRVLISFIVTITAGGLAACIMIRRRVQVYGCTYEESIDRYRCFTAQQEYSKQLLSAAEVEQCDKATGNTITEQSNNNNTISEVSRLSIIGNDRGKNVPVCAKNETTSLELGGYSRHAMHNQFFSEAAIISSVFLVALILAIISEMYIVVKGIFFRRDISFFFLMLTLTFIVLKELYPLFSGLRKIHDKTESANLVICGCSIDSYDGYIKEIREQVWGIVALLFIADVAVTFSKVVVPKGDSASRGNQTNNTEQIGASYTIDDVEEQKTREEIDDPWERGIQPPRSLWPRDIIRFIKDQVKETRNQG